MQLLVLDIWVVDQMEFICLADLFDYFVSAVNFYIDIALAMT